MQNHWLPLWLSCLLIGMVGCAGSISPSAVERTATPVPGTILPESPTTTRTGPSPSEATPTAGQVPDQLLADMRQDIVQRSGTPAEEIQVLTAEPVVWRNGSLGCPQPGMQYTQALVSGYRVVLAVDDQQYDYHANEQGFFLLCTAGATGATSVPGPAGEEGEMTPAPSVPPELQRYVDQAMADLATRLSIDADRVEVVEAKPVVWPDASLGCPQPGMRYKQVPQDGLLIRLAVGDRIYAYHSGGTREPFLCEQKYQAPKTTPLDLQDFVTPPGSENQ